MSSGVYLERTVKVDGREFSVLITPVSNGCFILISEGGTHRIGALNVSLPSAGSVNTAKVIPSRHDPLFLSVVSERLAAMINGICIASLYTASALDLKAMKSIMESVTNAIGAPHGSS
ncbi:MAG: hypothetical protein ACE5JV_00800 [Nitrososphaerales archaeon]